MNDFSIAIVMPAYNVEPYLNEALDSIQAQTMPPDELIIINDGSTDKTLEIAKSYSFPFRYEVISTENKGQGNARNIGINLATATYIYYFDSDDILDVNFIRDIKEILKNRSDLDMILFSGESFNDNLYSGNRWVDYHRGFSGIFENRIDLLNKGYLNEGLFCQPCLYVSRRELWGGNRLKFKNNYLEDEAIFFPLLFSCCKFSVIEKSYFYRRNRDNSTMTMRLNSKHVKGALDCIVSSLELYNSQKFSKKEEWHIRKRLEIHCLTYILMSKSTKSKISYRKLLNVFLANPNFILFAKTTAYILGLERVKSLKKLNDGIKLVIDKNR